MKNAQLQRDVNQLQMSVLRARASRDAGLAKNRSLEGAVAAARSHSDKIIIQQAGRTAAARRELLAAKQVIHGMTVLSAPAETATATLEPVEEKLIASLHERLAEGNAAYKTLMRKHVELRQAFDKIAAQNRQSGTIYKHWDQLCLRLYKSTRGKPMAESDQSILTTWVSWRQAKKAASSNQGVTSK